MTIVVPQTFVIATECQKIAEQNGYRRPLGETDGWVRYGSTTAQGSIYLAAGSAQGPWFLALDHPGVIEEMALPVDDMTGPGLNRFRFSDMADLYAIMARVYQLAVSLPDVPLQEFDKKTRDLPKNTEAERLVVQRIGQDIFRASLMDYWQGRCPLTGISDPALLRASHIIPWSDCATDADRLDVHNGLLLSALWDAAFDRFLVTFSDDGTPNFSNKLSAEARSELRWHAPLRLTDRTRARLAWHRARFVG